MKLILLGAPGAGKGTQSEIIAKRLSIPIISTGNILKEAVRNNTQLGQMAKGYLDAGQLVPDEVIISILKDRLADDDCVDGFILDGVPRTIEQAEALDAMGVEVDRVISLEVDDEVIMERMAGRRVCAACGSSFHIKHKRPAKEGVCDRCGGELIIRSDDNPETVAERLRVYHEITERLKDYYSRAGKLREVKGTQDIADTTRATLAALEG